LTTLIIDSDILQYKAAFDCEVAEEDSEGYWTWRCNFNDVVKRFDERVNWYVEFLSADDYILCVSDEMNYRKDIYPNYKILRQRKKRPLVLKAFRKYLIEERGAKCFPNLEGDDLCGIYATGDYIQDEKIIISEDKDLKTVPGYLFKGNEVKWYSEEEAKYWHFYQTLVGDQTDGYPGCKGIGPKKAETLLKENPSWETVVKCFIDNEFTEEDALVQARCAYILHDKDFNQETKEIKLWSPNDS